MPLFRSPFVELEEPWNWWELEDDTPSAFDFWIEKLAEIILSNGLITGDQRIDIETQKYLMKKNAIRTFLESIANSSLLDVWNDYQELISRHDFVYEMRYFENVVEHETDDVIKSMKGFSYDDDYFIVKDGRFTSSNSVKDLISIDELIKFYDKAD